MVANATVKQLTSLSDVQVTNLVALASDAFGTDDPSMTAVLGGDMSLKDELLTAMVRATLLEGRVYVVESNKEVVTICLIFRRQMALFKTDAQRKLGFNEVFGKLSPETQHWWQHEYPEQLAEKEKTIFSQEEKDRMWYFSLVATDPKHQRKGYASFFMDTFYRQVSRKGEILGLSTGTEANVVKYEGMKFKERGRMILKTVSDLDDMPCIWLSRG